MFDPLFIYLIVAYLISYVPWIGRYVTVINTLVHENGHAIAALLLKGKVYSIKLFMNTEGEAVTGQRGWFSSVVTAYAGYTCSSLVAYLCVHFLHRGHTVWILYGFIAIALVNLILWIRNLYGVVWLLSFVVLCGWTVYNGPLFLQTFVAYFLTAVMLTQSVSSAFQIFILSVVKRKEAGDATSLAHYTSIPAMFWGALFLVQSLYVAYQAVG